MRINESVCIVTSKVVLVPYCVHHVQKYHEWMKDEDIQAATASEPLDLDEEYAMQQSWRKDGDKLTFITCTPFQNAGTADSRAQEEQSMVGDVNLFVVVNEEDDSKLSLVGEFELMIAEKSNQRHGLGRAALLSFIAYVLLNQANILHEYFRSHSDITQEDHFDYFRVKINNSNERSIKLFESMGFRKTKSTPNVFDEFELRHDTLRLEQMREMMLKCGIEGYREVGYAVTDEANTLSTQS